MTSQEEANILLAKIRNHERYHFLFSYHLRNILTISVKDFLLNCLLVCFLCINIYQIFQIYSFQ